MMNNKIALASSVEKSLENKIVEIIDFVCELLDNVIKIDISNYRYAKDDLYMCLSNNTIDRMKIDAILEAKFGYLPDIIDIPVLIRLAQTAIFMRLNNDHRIDKSFSIQKRYYHDLLVNTCINKNLFELLKDKYQYLFGEVEL